MNALTGQNQRRHALPSAQKEFGENIVMSLCSALRSRFLPLGRKIWSRLRKYGILLHQRPVLKAAALQRRQLAVAAPVPGSRLVLFLLPPDKFLISGGVFSIIGLAIASRKVLGPDYTVHLVYFPHTSGFARYPYFPNTEIIFRFDEIMRRYPRPEKLLVHVPEFASDKLFTHPDRPECRYVRQAAYLHINILNQNILQLPEPPCLQHLPALSDHLSQTTAHFRYCTVENMHKWGMPLYYIGVWYWDNFPYVMHAHKQNCIAYSPDENQYAPMVIAELRRRLPHFRFIRISGVSYQRYLEIISMSKYVITFGEGADGYFFESYLCGSLGCAVYNTTFFPPQIEKNIQTWQTLYESYECMAKKLPDDILEFEAHPYRYVEYNRKKRYWISGNKTKALKNFYRGLQNFYTDIHFSPKP